jgi:hypothetical protein
MIKYLIFKKQSLHRVWLSIGKLSSVDFFILNIKNNLLYKNKKIRKNDYVTRLKYKSVPIR